MRGDQRRARQHAGQELGGAVCSFVVAQNRRCDVKGSVDPRYGVDEGGAGERCVIVLGQFFQVRVGEGENGDRSLGIGGKG